MNPLLHFAYSHFTYDTFRLKYLDPWGGSIFHCLAHNIFPGGPHISVLTRNILSGGGGGGGGALSGGTKYSVIYRAARAYA